MLPQQLVKLQLNNYLSYSKMCAQSYLLVTVVLDQTEFNIKLVKKLFKLHSETQMVATNDDAACIKMPDNTSLWLWKDYSSSGLCYNVAWYWLFYVQTDSYTFWKKQCFYCSIIIQKTWEGCILHSWLSIQQKKTLLYITQQCCSVFAVPVIWTMEFECL